MRARLCPVIRYYLELLPYFAAEFAFLVCVRASFQCVGGFYGPAPV